MSGTIPWLVAEIRVSFAQIRAKRDNALLLLCRELEIPGRLRATCLVVQIDVPGRTDYGERPPEKDRPGAWALAISDSKQHAIRRLRTRLVHRERHFLGTLYHCVELVDQGSLYRDGLSGVNDGQPITLLGEKLIAGQHKSYDLEQAISLRADWFLFKFKGSRDGLRSSSPCSGALTAWMWGTS